MASPRLLDHVLSKTDCDILRKIAESRLITSKVYSPQSDNVDLETRVSDQCWLYDSENLDVLNRLTKKIEDELRIPSKWYEALQVVRYKPGGFYKPHYDACTNSLKECKRMNGDFKSQRYITFLIYLNDDYEGGETHFPKIPFTTKPKMGSAVIFFNTDTQGKILDDALHGGNPVRKGEKWICNRWIHYPKESVEFFSWSKTKVSWLFIFLILLSVLFFVSGKK